MKRPVQLGIASLKALATVAVFGAAAHAAMPYLPLIGPPPLRILAVKRPVSAAVGLATTPALTSTNPLLSTAGSTNLTSAAPAAPAAPVAVQGPLIGPDLGRSLGSTPGPSVFMLPTPDLVGISPQALAAYFRPVSQGTNAVVPIGLMPVSFVPPVPPVPPDKSSHAEYNVK